ncbi:MAG: MFS transporter, partial [Actinomycetota bacterium]|nr:MFS transporter [Actinomycetota bacterium]
DTLRATASSVRARPVLLAVLLVAALHGMSTEGFDRLWELALLRSVSLPEVGSLGVLPWFGLLRAGGLLLAIGATVVIRCRLDVRGAGAAARALLVVDGLQLVAGVAYGLASSLAVAVAAYWAGSLLRQLHGPLFNTWLNTGLASRSRATVNSAASQADALGQVTGGPVLGLIASARSVAAALVASGLVRAPTLAVLAWSRTPR